jgi:hypothetical protein
MTTLPKTLTIEGVTYHRAPEPAPEPTPEPAPLGEPWQPKWGERYWYVNSVGEVVRDEWWCTSTDRDRRAFGNCFATEAEGTAARDTIALTLRAWRVASDLWRERPAPPVGAYAYAPYVAYTDDGAIVHGAGAFVSYSPYNFATREDCNRFIAALGDDAVRRLLGGEA